MPEGADGVPAGVEAAGQGQAHPALEHDREPVGGLAMVGHEGVARVADEAEPEEQGRRELPPWGARGCARAASCDDRARGNGCGEIFRNEKRQQWQGRRGAKENQQRRGGGGNGRGGAGLGRTSTRGLGAPRAEGPAREGRPPGRGRGGRVCAGRGARGRRGSG